LRGWLQVSTLTNPNAAVTAYSVARSLRELGMLDQALKILSALASALRENPFDSHPPEQVSPHRMCFLYRPNNGKNHLPSFPLVGNCRNEQTYVLGLWLMAVLTVEQCPDERGRIRALSLLHSASDALRRILYQSNIMDEATKMVCLELYECIEEEARVLFQPMQLLPNPHQPSFESEVQETIVDVLTPMREKRWYFGRMKQRLTQNYETSHLNTGSDHLPMMRLI